MTSDLPSHLFGGSLRFYSIQNELEKVTRSVSEGVKKLGNAGIFARGTAAAGPFSNTLEVRRLLENWLNIQRGSLL
jgi:hypothetical protein